MRHLRPALPALLILLLAFLLRLPLLNGSLWLDEAAQALESARPLHQQLDIAPDFQPPLLHLLLHGALYLSKAEWWLRTVGALIPGLLTIWVTMRIGEFIRNKQVGWLAGLLLATSSFHIFYSQELRQYSLPALWGTLSWFVLLSWNTRSTSRNILFLSGCTLAGVYTSYLYPFLALSQVIYGLFWKRQQAQAVVSSMLIAALGFLPWLPRFLEQLSVGGQLRTALPGWEDVVSFSQLKSLPLVAGKFLFGVIDISLEPSIVLATLGVLAAVGYLTVYTWQHRRDHGTLLPLLLWLLVPPLAAWVVSFWVPVIQPKRVLYLLPAVYLVVADVSWQSVAHAGKIKRGVLHILKRTPALRLWPHVASLTLIATLFTTNLVSTALYYQNPNYQRENWRTLQQHISQSFPATETLIVFSFPEPFAPWIWYDQGQFDTLATGVLHVSQLQSLRHTLEPITNYRYVLVFDYLRTLTDPQDAVLREIAAYGYEGKTVIDTPNIGFVRVYVRSSDATAWHTSE